ncbi:MAG: hypothetical protein ABI690_06815 [Chloroflexota bacterium]
MINFDPLLEAVKQQVQSAGRARHLTATLPELFALIPTDVTLADLVAGWRALAHPQSEHEETAVAHRRMMFSTLSEIAVPLVDEPGNLAGAVRIWQAWDAAFQKRWNPHQRAMAKTLARELAELQNLVKLPG